MNDRKLFRDLMRFPHEQPSSGMDKQTAFLPRVDISETDNSIVLHADLPGIQPNDVQVSVENGVLTMSGKRETSHSKQEKDAQGNVQIHRTERSYGQFTRSFTLPKNVDVSSISATSANGVLEISIPKMDVKKPECKMIPITMK
eukprot:TRINITY_DN1305_c0_g1::TRINITY_DN1305_c0_g1_i1::g.19943::m.19943 TRINITY_DN1305_c0_g1::TRINITY_DN1305_c0_g1_i1::g.19943  ORF type:complete len:144 (-),score=46.72,sp/P13853/HS17C_ARATH/45.54/2e-22,HSP20/PF00011.16/1.6e-25,BON/PF04972.12/0.045,BON/PF04972.12/2.5e+02,CS/PF04969.11/0.02,DUF4097/PF13349.1/0.037 TRINITY_DN1305_c0_g1_i1:125-556(-)